MYTFRHTVCMVCRVQLITTNTVSLIVTMSSCGSQQDTVKAGVDKLQSLHTRVLMLETINGAARE